MFVASLFEVVIVKPIFNLLVLIYGLLPGHNFGLSIILFTIVVRLLMWPLVKKQLHQAKAMRELQPELKRIKKAAKGNTPARINHAHGALQRTRHQSVRLARHADSTAYYS